MLAARALASAAIDLSDGLIQDLGHVCRASGVGAEVEASRVPLAAAVRTQRPGRRLALGFAGGEDYELLFTVPRARLARLDRTARVSGRRVPRLTAIGEIVSGAGVSVLDDRGAAVEIAGGFDHYRR
jgi:thiamine-monophosphate kinase